MPKKSKERIKIEAKINELLEELRLSDAAKVDIDTKRESIVLAIATLEEIIKET